MAFVVDVRAPDGAALTSEVTRMVSVADAIEIDSHDMYTEAAAELRRIKTKINTLDEQRKGITKPLDDAKGRVMELFRVPLDCLRAAESALKARMIAWDDKIAAERRAAQIAAERAAQAERDRLDAEQRAAQEREAQAQREAEQAQVAAAQATDEGSRLAALQRAEAAAKATEVARGVAEAAAMQSVMTVAPVAQAAPERVTGIASRATWDAAVTDKVALIRHIAEHPEYANLLVPDTVALRSLARAQKDALALPGVRVFQKRGVSARAADDESESRDLAVVE